MSLDIQAEPGTCSSSLAVSRGADHSVSRPHGEHTEENDNTAPVTGSFHYPLERSSKEGQSFGLLGTEVAEGEGQQRVRCLGSTLVEGGPVS